MLLIVIHIGGHIIPNSLLVVQCRTFHSHVVSTTNHADVFMPTCL